MLFTPEGFSASGVTVQVLLVTAYKMQDNQISGAPDWINSAKFDIEAAIDESMARELKKLEPEQRVLVGQRMLSELSGRTVQVKGPRREEGTLHLLAGRRTRRSEASGSNAWRSIGREGEGA
jgi:uncharacterized protein (TIGR03435 family)